jgi:acyl carrier protein
MEFTGGTLHMPTDTYHEISAFIAKEILKQPGRSIAGDTVLISSGLVDSFNLVDLAMFVEDHFGVKIEDTELTAETFDTLDQLSALVDSRRTSG